MDEVLTKIWMRNLSKNRKGFTLIEILVVISIIAMLSTLAVSGYLTYRKSALLDLTADNLVSQVNAMRSKTIYGSSNTKKIDEIKNDLLHPSIGPNIIVNDCAGVNADPNNPKCNLSKPKCEGVYFHSANSASFVAENFEQDFNNQKYWNGNAWIYDACGNFDSSKTGLAFELDQQVEILNISLDNEPLTSLVMRFVPTNGALEISKDGGHNFISDFTPGDAPKFIKIEIQYGAIADVNYQRIISFNLLTGKTTVAKVADTISN